MSIGIIYCETLKSEITDLASRFTEISHLQEMPWRLHIEPDNLLAEVEEQIEKMQENVDAIVLGYGRCQAMDRLKNTYKVPVLRPEAEDCIGILLGQKRYEQEVKKVAGTWFLSPGWTRMGTDFVFHELQLNRGRGKEIDSLKFARRLLEGFTRALYINMQSCDEIEDLRPQAQKIADDLNLRLEETEGSSSMLEQVINQALARIKKPTDHSE